MACDEGCLASGDQAVGGELSPVGAGVGGTADPQDGLQVAQPARALLDARFEVVGAFLVTGVALLLFELLGLAEQYRVQACRQPLAERRGTPPCTAQQARFQQVGLHRHVARRDLEALFQGAHAVADLQPDVPERADQLLDLRLELGPGILGEQHEEVDVRPGKQFAPAVAADREQRSRLRHLHMAPGLAQQAIGERGLSAQHAPCGQARQVALAQLRATVGQALAQAGGQFGAIRRGQCVGQCVGHGRSWFRHG